MIQVVCFSKDRPLQLHGYLNSFFKHCAEPAAVKVLVQSQPQWFSEAYAQVAAEFPQVKFRYERDFHDDLLGLLDSEPEYTVFGCDDVVYMRSVSGLTSAFDVSTVPLIGVSLRLGCNVLRGMFGDPMAHPDFVDKGAPWLVWDVNSQQCGADWAYPWDMDGTVYPTDFVLRMVNSFAFTNPNTLEAHGALEWQSHTDRRHLAAWPSARIVVPTVNVVQSVFPNGICGDTALDAGFLLDAWNHGMRLDVDRYEGMSPESWRIPDFYLTRAV